MTLDQRPLVVDVQPDSSSVAVRLAGELDVATASTQKVLDITGLSRLFLDE